MIQEHGGNVSGIKNILDLSANINPLGAPESVKRAIAESVSDIERYPDPYCSELRKRLAARENVPAENIVCGNGADDLIFRTVHAFRPEKAIICVPTFGEYKRALAEAGCEASEYFLREENGFEVTEDFIEALDASFDMCFICSPNNPTGRLVPRETLEKLSRKCAENGITLVCDECFSGFAEDGERRGLRRFLNGSCVILKAFTKLCATPGVRLGYAVCGDAETAGRIARSGQFWSVSNLAQAAGLAALGEVGYVRETAAYVAKEREFLSAELASLGFRVYPSEANFLLFKGGEGLGERLLGEGLLIRDCRNFSGLSAGYYRVAVRTREENVRLTEALRRIKNG